VHDAGEAESHAEYDSESERVRDAEPDTESDRQR